MLTAGLACAICGRFRMRGEWLTRSRFLWLVLVPIVLSAMCFTFAAGIAVRVFWSVADGALCGVAVYFAAWVIGRLAARRWDLHVLFFDLFCWVGAGAVVGVIISYGMQVIATHPDNAQAIVVPGLSSVVLVYLAGTSCTSESRVFHTGWLLYIKPTYHGTSEGVDVRSYAADHPAFPHESTTDQWFSESQLEAYRALGAHIIEEVCNAGVRLARARRPRR